MSPTTVIQALESLRARADGDDKVALGHAVKLIEQLGGQVASLKMLASQRFRPSSEKVAPGQIAMHFLEHLLTQTQQPREDTKPDDPSPKPRDKRKSRVKLLPVRPVHKTLRAEDLQCTCGQTKHDIGYDTRRQIIYEPPQLYMQEERLHKYACRACAEGVTMAHGSPKLIDGSLASSSLLAHLTVAKVVDCMPIERIGKQLARHDAELAPSTLYDWFAYGGKEVVELQPRIRRELLASKLISLDDTPLPTKNPAHDNGIQRGRLWLYIGDIERIAYCAFSEDWKGKHPQRVLAGFAGDVQGDGYGGITRLFNGPAPPQRVGCNDHARRKFVEAMKMGDSRAAGAVALFARLYAIERQATEACATADERLTMRQSMSLAVWAQLDACIEELSKGASPKGPIGKAVTYWRKQKTTLAVFLSNGHLPISNAHVERLLRTVALLRKNALFVGSIDAGHRYAALLTMALNCTLCGANPFAYFTWLFDRLAERVPARRALDLLPQAWLRTQQAAD
jgi:transposase